MVITRIQKDKLHLFEEIYYKRTSKPLNVSNINDPNLFLYVIHEEEVYGWMSLVKVPKVGYRDAIYYLDELYVYPNAQNKGYGSQLLSYMKERFKGETLRLIVDKENRNALHLYKKHGFEVMSEGYYMERKTYE